MAHIPNHINIPSAIKRRDNCIGYGIVALLVAWGSFAGGSAVFGLTCTVFGIALLGIAAKIKTKKKLQSIGSIYK